MTSSIFIYYTPGWQPLADVVLPSARKYCDNHWYDLQNFNFATEMPVGRHKMIGLEAVLKLYDYTWVLDLDTLITNPAIKFTDFTDNEHDIFITNDVHGINAGSFVIRDTESSRAFIETVISEFGDAPEEQTVMKRHLDMVKVKYLPHPSINSYKYELYAAEWDDKVGAGIEMPTHEQGQWQPGDLLLHLPGLDMGTRIETFKQIICNHK